MNSARLRAISCAVVSAWLLLGNATAQLAPNQTEGFGKDQLLTFTYGQNFSCVTGPFNDLDHNGLIAAVDPDEFQTPHCVVAFTPATTPAGVPVKEVQKLWVIAPFFETNTAEPAFTPELGAALKDLFGFVPDAFKIHPGVAVQCPEPMPWLGAYSSRPRHGVHPWVEWAADDIHPPVHIPADDRSRPP